MTSAVTTREPERTPEHVSSLGQDTEDVLVVDEVGRRFGGHTVLDGVSFSVRKGELFALIGPSGSGKSTLIELMTGLLVPTSGTIEVFGTDPTTFSAEQKATVGYVPQRFVLYPSLTVEQNLKFVAGIYGIGWLDRCRRIRRMLETVDLWHARRKLAAHISGGMQRRLSLAGGLIHSPTLLFVDEPTAGLDPELRVRIWDYLRLQSAMGVTVVVTTQYLEEAERCDRTGILDAADLIALGTPGELRARAIGGQAIDVETDGYNTAAVDALYSIHGVRSVDRIGWHDLRVVVDPSAVTVEQIVAALETSDVNVKRAGTFEPSFEDVFLALVRSRRE